MKQAILALFFLAVFSKTAQAQTRPVDIIYLKNGESYSGEIIQYEQGVKVVLRQADGIEIEVPDADVKKIVQGVALGKEEAGSQPVRERKVVPPKMKGFYNSTFLAFAFGSGGGQGLALGAGIHNVSGIQWKPGFGTGIGIGVDNYARRGETLYPLFVEIKGYLPAKKKKNGSYYYALGGGYGFAFKREKLDITKATGGFMAYPAIGYRATTEDGTDVNVDFGVKVQKATFSHQLESGDLEIRNIVYRRIIIRVGLTLWK